LEYPDSRSGADNDPHRTHLGNAICGDGTVIFNKLGPSDWRVDFGLRQIRWRNVLLTVTAGIALFFAVKLFLQPLCDQITHSTRNLHSFDRIRGHPRQATLLTLKTMLLAGLCEEIIFRGTVQQRLRTMFANFPGSTLLSIVLAAGIFTAFHWYQGPSGLLLVAVLGLFDCTVYMMADYTLTYTVILHLVYTAGTLRDCSELRFDIAALGSENYWSLLKLKRISPARFCQCLS
jgi:membrane protease YdiL (CAAX protease family)